METRGEHQHATFSYWSKYKILSLCMLDFALIDIDKMILGFGFRFDSLFDKTIDLYVFKIFKNYFWLWLEPNNNNVVLLYNSIV